MVFSDLALSRRLERAEGQSCVEFAQARQRLTPDSGAAWMQCGGAYAVFDGVDSPVTQSFGLGLFEELSAASLDELGMVMDFSEIKRVVSNWIDENLDHRMILHRDDPAREALEHLGEPLYLIDVNPTAENIAKLIFDYARSQDFPVVETLLWETPRCFATYTG